MEAPVHKGHASPFRGEIMPVGGVPCVLLKLKPGFPVRPLQLNTFRSASSKHELPAQMAHCA